jgi:Flp pilus assembly protein TadD
VERVGEMTGFIGHASHDLALQLLKEGNLKDCIDCANKVLETEPEDAAAYSILGAAYTRAGQRGMAIAAFEQAVSISSTAKTHFNLGSAYEQSERYEDAAEQFRTAVQLDACYARAKEALDRIALLLSSPEVPHGHDHSPHLLSSED